jgi:hypothetical protein
VLGLDSQQNPIEILHCPVAIQGFAAGLHPSILFASGKRHNIFETVFPKLHMSGELFAWHAIGGCNPIHVSAGIENPYHESLGDSSVFHMNISV